MMAKGKELSQELREQIVDEHINGIGYRRISKLLNVHISTVASIVRKWKEHKVTSNRPRAGAPRKISERAVKNIVQKVIEEPKTTRRELQKDLEAAGTIVTLKTVSSTLKHAGIISYSSRKIPLLEESHIVDVQQFAEEDLEKEEVEDKIWNNIPIEFSNTPTITSFKDHLYKHLLDQ